MNIHIYNLFYICTGTHACMGFVPDNKLIRIRIRIVYIIIDLDEKMTSPVLKFADDTQISSNSQQELQRDLDTAVEWAQTWQMQHEHV